MINSLQHWQDRLKTDREAIYFADIIGRSGLFSSTTHMVFLSNRRLIFVKKSPFSLSIQSSFIREVRGMRLKQRRYGLLGVAGLIMTCVGGYIYQFGLPVAEPLVNPLSSGALSLLSLGLGCIAFVLFFILSERRMLLDVNGLNDPLSMRWQGKEDQFLKLTNDITYHRSLWEDAGIKD